MLIVPTTAVPSQVLSVSLDGQAVQLRLYYRASVGALFADVSLSTVPLRLGVVCRDRNRIIRSAYLGLAGDFVVVDTQGTSDPIYTGLGTRWLLVYLEAADVAALA